MKEMKQKEIATNANELRKAQEKADAAKKAVEDEAKNKENLAEKKL